MGWSQMTNNNSEPGSEHIMTGDWGQLHRGEYHQAGIILNDTNVMSHTLRATIGTDTARYLDIINTCGPHVMCNKENLSVKIL